jgi:hypothetical protein
VKVPNRPDEGNGLAESKGALREEGSERSWKQKIAPMNKNRMRRTYRTSVPMNVKSNTHTECANVDPAGINRKVYGLTRGDLQNLRTGSMEKSAEPIVGCKTEGANSQKESET